MDCYIEVSLITNMLICIVSYFGSMYISYSKSKHLYMYFFIFIEQILHIYFENIVMFILYELCFYGCLCISNIKTTVVYICIKYLIAFTLFKYIPSSFHMGHIYIQKDVNVVGIWILFLIFIVLLKSKWNAFIQVQDYIYDVYFYTNKPFRLKGYLDTGNNASHNNIPILFVDCSYEYLFYDLPSTQTFIYTLSSSSLHTIYLCDVCIKGYKKGGYYICCDEQLCLEFSCKCLLNIES